jgi:hypothetical protein
MDEQRKGQRLEAAGIALGGGIFGGVTGTLLGGLCGYGLASIWGGDTKGIDFLVLVKLIAQIAGTLFGAVLGGAGGGLCGAAAASYWLRPTPSSELPPPPGPPATPVDLP